MPGAPFPIQAGGRLYGKADGQFSVGALNVETAKDRSVSVHAANFSVHCGSRHSRRVGARCSRIVQRRRQDGLNDGYGVDGAVPFYQNVHGVVIALHSYRRQDGGGELPRAVSTTTPTNTACRVGASGCAQLPTGDRVRRLDMRRNYAMARYSPRP